MIAGVFQHARFNLQAVLQLAKQLRNIPCSCDLSQKPKSGSHNWAILLSFNDGVEWLFRSPRTSYGVDEDIAGILLASEAATLKYVRMNSSIPVPDVFYYRLDSYNLTQPISNLVLTVLPNLIKSEYLSS